MQLGPVLRFWNEVQTADLCFKDCTNWGWSLKLHTLRLQDPRRIPSTISNMGCPVWNSSETLMCAQASFIDKKNLGLNCGMEISMDVKSAQANIRRQIPYLSLRPFLGQVDHFRAHKKVFKNKKKKKTLSELLPRLMIFTPFWMWVFLCITPFPEEKRVVTVLR